MVTQKYAQSEPSQTKDVLNKDLDLPHLIDDQLDIRQYHQKNDLYTQRYKSPDVILREEAQELQKSRVEKLKQELDYSQRELDQKYGKSSMSKSNSVEGSHDVNSNDDKQPEIHDIKTQRMMLEEEIKQLDYQLEKESRSLKLMQSVTQDEGLENVLNDTTYPIPDLRNIKNQNLADYRQHEEPILSHDENIKWKNNQKGAEHQNVIQGIQLHQKLDLRKSEKKEDGTVPESYLRIQDDEYTSEHNIDDQSPLYNNRGQKYGPEYYHLNKQRALNCSPVEFQDEIPNNEFGYDPEIKAIEDKYSSDQISDIVQDKEDLPKTEKYKGPFSRYLEEPNKDKMSMDPHQFSPSEFVNPKELRSSFIHEVEGVAGEGDLSQNDNIIDVFLNSGPDGSKAVSYHSGSNFSDYKDKEIHDFSNKKIKTTKRSRHFKNNRMSPDQLDHVIEDKIGANKPDAIQKDKSKCEASFGKKHNFRPEIEGKGDDDKFNAFNPNLENKREKILLLKDDFYDDKQHQFKHKKSGVLKKQKSSRNEVNTGKFGDDPVENNFEDELDRNSKSNKSKKSKKHNFTNDNDAKHKMRLKQHLSRQNRLELRNTQIVNKNSHNDIKNLKYINYDYTDNNIEDNINDNIEEHKNKSLDDNSFSLKESSRIHYNENTLDNRCYNKEGQYQNSLKDISKIVDKIQYKSQKQIQNCKNDPNVYADTDYTQEAVNKRINNDSFADTRAEYLYDQYQRAHQNIVDRLSVPKSVRKRGKKKKSSKPSKTTRFNDKSISITDQFYDDEIAQGKQDYLERASSIIDHDYVLLDPEEPLILDDNVMKFHPGFSINYVSRWAQVTRTVIRFYKNYYHSVCSFRRPLAAIPIQYIKDVKKCSIKAKMSNAIKVFDKKLSNVYDTNQFEIVLKEDYEAIYNLNKKRKEYEDLQFEYELVQRLDFQNNLTKKYKEYRQKIREQKSGSRSPLVPSMTHDNIDNPNIVQNGQHNRTRGDPNLSILSMQQFKRDEISRVNRSHSRIDAHSTLFDHESVKSLMKLNKSHEHLQTVNDTSNVSSLSRGRQRKYEVSGDRSFISIDEQFVHSSRSKSRTRNYTKARLISKKKGKSMKRAKTPFDSTQIVDGHLMPIRVNKNKKDNKSSFSRDKILKRRAKCEWSKRETDWFKFERRYILSAKTKEERRLWISTLKDLIQNY